MKYSGQNSPATQLSETQIFVLNAAADHAQGHVEKFPENVKGGARAKVIDGLNTRGWITPANDGWVITDAGRTAIGREVVKLIEVVEVAEVAEVVEIVEAVEVAETPQAQPAETAKEPNAQKPAKAEKAEKPIKVRAPSKQEVMLSLLKREGGTSLIELMSATGWQQHSVRGALSTLNKGLGGVIENAKRDCQRVYWIGAPVAEQSDVEVQDARINDSAIAA